MCNFTKYLENIVFCYDHVIFGIVSFLCDENDPYYDYDYDYDYDSQDIERGSDEPLVQRDIKKDLLLDRKLNNEWDNEQNNESSSDTSNDFYIVNDMDY